jgi:hypothetical protein
MHTILDGTSSWYWFPESAEYHDHELRLVLVEGATSAQEVDVEILPGTTLSGLRPITISSDARRVLVYFKDVRLLHVLDEGAHKPQENETRDNGVVARHYNSALLRWVGETTQLTDMLPGELSHYSVETAEDFYHVLTRLEPQVTQIEA